METTPPWNSDEGTAPLWKPIEVARLDVVNNWAQRWLDSWPFRSFTLG
jgi:hypothetical protein